MLLCGKVILLLFYIDIGKYSMSKTVSNMLLADKYTLGDCLGEGTFASVSEAVNTKTNQRAAIKQIFIQAHFIDQAVDEVEKASMVKSDHVVKVYEYFYDPSQFYFNVVLELCPSSLRDQVADKYKYSEEELAQFLVQMCSAFLSLRENNLIHLDFKPENILMVDKSGKFFKICDFGCAQISMYSRMSGYEKNAFGTFNYLAPQVHLNYKGQKRRSSADIWALGITLYEMVYQRLPFTIKAEEQLINRSLLEKYFHEQGYQIEYPFSDQAPQRIIEIMKLMLAPKPIDRINWQQLKDHLMRQYGIQEYEFMPIENLIENFIPMADLFVRVIELLKQGGPSKKVQFWKSNSLFLQNLKELIVYYLYIFTQPVHYAFYLKKDYIKVNKSEKTLILLQKIMKQRQKCKDKINGFEKKDIGYRQTLLLDGLKISLNLLQQEQSRDESMTFLLTFCQELYHFIQGTSESRNIFTNTIDSFGKSLQF